MGVQAIGERAYGMLFHPSEEFPEVRDEPLRRVLLYWIVLLAVFALLALITGFVYLVLMRTPGSFLHFTSSWQVYYRVFTLLAAFIGLLLVILWLHLWIYLLGGRKGVKQTIKAFLYSQTPAFLLVWIPLPGIARMVLLCLAAFWVLWLLFVGIEELQEVSGTTALAAVIFALASWVTITYLLTELLMLGVTPL
jgi:hypothetical protein